MPLKTSEARWFSNSKEVLWDIFFNLEEIGEGNPEGERSDFYLKSATPSAGIKIREGRHELKVKTAEDEKSDLGIIQHWSKWSYEDEENILNSALLQDWIEVKKIRFKKQFGINEGKVNFTSAENIKEKCEAEFAIFEIPFLQLKAYTFGLEASGTKEKENLEVAMRHLSLSMETLKNLKSCSYPEFLANPSF
ncbi:hypothetical protein [Autumnicola musiva]|uniref:Activator of Hsp90 ATPase N-terminal domain-containing protein n=1 Tax=Autumnicola musiva TaxID=3075589 RepID=A0ABU3D525_9FLAO|nr:hypothetical protein [Zunongwangia sp. F117]MDT0676445.1 hypothetical protein [Zunongwangia sp. F117]